MHRRLLLPCIALFAFVASLLGCGGSYQYKLAESPPAEPAYGGEAMGSEARHAEATAGEAEPMLEMDEAAPAGGRGDYLPPPPPAPVFAKAGPPKKGETGGSGKDARDGKAGDATKPSPVTVDASSQPTPPPTGAKPPDSGVQAITGPLLIYNATVYMAVYEAKAAIEATLKLARDMGGYLVRRNDQTLVVRVPAAKYREALDAVGKLGDVIHREENVQDVTEEFLDLQIRVQNARALRQRLEQLLTQTKNVEEALMVEHELARVTEQIERFEGRLKLLRELVAFSTITIEFKPRPTDQVQSNIRLPFDWLDKLGLSHLLSL